MTVPTTYADWSDWLDVFAKGGRDAEVLSALGSGRMSWSPGVAEMFGKRLSETLSERLTSCGESLSRNMSRSSEETSLLRAIFDTRRALLLLHRFSSLAPLPELLSKHLCAQVASFAQRTQSSLEDSAKKDRSGRLSSLFRNNTLVNYASQSEAATTSSAQAPLQPAQPMDEALPTSGIRRRNFLV